MSKKEYESTLDITNTRSPTEEQLKEINWAYRDGDLSKPDNLNVVVDASTIDKTLIQYDIRKTKQGAVVKASLLEPFTGQPIKVELVLSIQQAERTPVQKIFQTIEKQFENYLRDKYK